MNLKSMRKNIVFWEVKKTKKKDFHPSKLPLKNKLNV